MLRCVERVDDVAEKEPEANIGLLRMVVYEFKHCLVVIANLQVFFHSNSKREVVFDFIAELSVLDVPNHHSLLTTFILNQFIKALFSLTAKHSFIDKLLDIMRHYELVVNIIVGILIEIVNDGLMDIETDEICSRNRWHSTPCKRTENGINVVNTAIILILFRVNKSLVDYVKTDSVAKKGRKVFAFSDTAVKSAVKILFEFFVQLHIAVF